MRTNKGFTLIELMLVAGIVTVLALVATPIIMKAMPARNLNRAAREVVSNLRKARTMAIKYHREVTVRFDVSHEKYVVDDGGTNIWIPPDESMPEFYGSGIRFGYTAPGGNSRSDKVTFSEDKVTFNTVGLTDTTGFVYVQNKNRQGYRIGIVGMAANILIDKCGQKDSAGVTIDCLD